MTFSDLMDDLEALWFAALWFEGRAAGVPEMNSKSIIVGPRVGLLFWRLAATLRGLSVVQPTLAAHDQRDLHVGSVSRSGAGT